jgi:hypothetical protein
MAYSISFEVSSFFIIFSGDSFYITSFKPIPSMRLRASIAFSLFSFISSPTSFIFC